jgi:prepilin-type N-terminal cleavage/methylation domain-containing protein/prepilin-type processing-associated H-X9-DG protein
MKVLKKIRIASGFTLVELLVVIAMIGILSGILLPSMAKAKAKATGVACLGNTRQLALAWNLYALDANDRLVYNLGLDRRQPVPPPNRNLNWVNNVMSWELDSDNTNTAFVFISPLASYWGRSLDLLRCPADRVLSEVQRRAGWSNRVRSFSMNAMVGDAGPNVVDGGNVLNPGYKQFLKMQDIPHPSGIFVFLDEHPDSIGDGYFYNNEEEAEWIHLPASYHNGAGNFSFADGHTESHRWLSALTKQPAKPDAVPLPMPIPTEHSDFEWLAERTSVDQ